MQIGHQLVPRFMSAERRQGGVLEIIRQRLGRCGYIKSNGRRDRAVVLVVRKRADLLRHVIPFFEAIAAFIHKAAGLREVRTHSSCDGDIIIGRARATELRWPCR